MIEALNATNAVDAEVHAKLYGGFNDAPPGWREVSEADIAYSGILSKIITHVEYRQITGGVRPPFAPKHAISMAFVGRLFFNGSDGGWAMEPNQSTKHVRWYRFGCDHSYKELSQTVARIRGYHHYGNCYHVYECRECGRIEAQDSGD